MGGTCDAETEERKRAVDLQLEDLLMHKNSYEQAEYLLVLLASHNYLAAKRALSDEELRRIDHVVLTFADLRYEQAAAMVKGLSENLAKELVKEDPPEKGEKEDKDAKKGRVLLERWVEDGLIR